MGVRYVIWLLVFLIAGVSVDSLPDPPAIKSQAGDCKIVLNDCNHGHATTRVLPLAFYFRDYHLFVSRFPLRQEFQDYGFFDPLPPAFHSSGNSPPVPSHS
jgi:hypothetical protein